jgi:hypothetical protein
MAIDYKFGIPESGDREWNYGNVWADEKTSGGGSRQTLQARFLQSQVVSTGRCLGWTFFAVEVTVNAMHALEIASQVLRN